ncbi:MAG: trypsin-like peptidase domain-containing protein [Parasporobacterium sp.]|nr:trypsin-like peptidase domain-containing protein [Parasporobacterium sp.]
MQDDFNKDPFDEEKKNDQSDEKQDIPRWTPYDEEYKTVSKPEKTKKRWIIPLVIVLSLMVIGIAVGLIFGAKSLENMVKDSQTLIEDTQPVQTDDPAVISTTDTSAIKETTNGKMVLTDVSDVVEEVMPAVVSITSRTLVESGGYNDYWDFFFGNRQGTSDGETQEVDQGYGSGTIISQNSTELLILTSFHVVDGSSSLYVTFTDGTSVDGSIKSQSDADDIAIVSVPLANIPEETMNSIRIANLSTEEAQVGEGAIVIGNAMGYGMSVTSGIISATNRQITVNGKTLTVMQTDAAINSGNSGGCVLNKNGEVIGISEAKIVVSNVEGMCYAIPVSSNTELIQTLLNLEGEANPSGNANGEHSAYLGIRGRDIDSILADSYGMPRGIYVAGTTAGGGAEAAGILEGDIIVGMDNVSFTTMSELQEQLSRHEPGDVVTIILMREVDGRYSQTKVDVTLTGEIAN